MPEAGLGTIQAEGFGMAPMEDFSNNGRLGISKSDSIGGPHDFSLVVGGPLFQLLRRLHLSGDALEHLPARVVFITLIAWLPPLLLVSVSRAGLASFLRDVEMHVRLLAALPALIAGEQVVHSRIRLAVSRFVTRTIVSPNDLSRFDNAIESAVHLRDSTVAQIALLMLVYTLGLWLWNSRVHILAPTWYAIPGGRWHLTPAGDWYVFVSIPIVQFVLLCWYWRFFIWCRFLWQVSRIDLNLISTHPDRCAGLAFLGEGAYAFGPILFAQGSMLAGVVASRVLYRGESLMSFKLQILGFVAFFVLVILGPLLFFTPQLAAAKRRGLGVYGQFAQEYVEKFEWKWVAKGAASTESLLGSQDIQALADLSNSYSIVGSMRLVPFGLNDIIRLAAVAVAPFLPLLLTIFSFEQLIMRLIKVIF